MSGWKVAFFCLALSLFAANAKLYLKDGSFHIVREYKVLSDRVRYYSVERGDWEEIPLELVDVKRTEAEVRERQQTVEKESKELAEEDKAVREARREAYRVPENTGAYLVDGEQVRAIKQAEIVVRTDKKRSILTAISPIPIIAGKATVELNGERSENVVAVDRPEFYIRLAAEERFGIFRLKAQKGVRVVEKVSIIPVTKEYFEEPELVEIFRKQVQDGLYKIWPTKPLTPGEYAVVEYTEGKLNLQVWDFAYYPAAK